MNKLLLKLSGLASLVLLLHTSGFAQSADDKDAAPEKTKGYEEIIIKHKSDKDAKVTIEIKDGEVLVNGKPVSDFEDSSLSIRKRKIKIVDDRNFSFSSPDGNVFLTPDGQGMIAPPPAYGSRGGGWSYDGGDMAPAGNHAFLGVSSEKPSNGEGARIVGVTEGSSAEKLGLRKGDVITKVNETAVTDPESLSANIRTHKPGDKVVITFTREGKVQKETVTLGKNKGVERFNFKFQTPDMPNMPDMQNFNFDGVMPREFGQSFGNSLKFGIKGQDTEDGKGVKVLDVDDESAAAKAGIKEGDIITRFDGKEVNSATALAEAARAAKEKASVKISLLHDGKPQEIEVKVPKRLRTANL